MEVFLQALVNGILLGVFYSLMGMGQNIICSVYLLWCGPLRSASHRRSAHVRSGFDPRRILRRHFPWPAGADERAVHQPVLQ